MISDSSTAREQPFAAPGGAPFARMGLSNLGEQRRDLEPRQLVSSLLTNLALRELALALAALGHEAALQVLVGIAEEVVAICPVGTEVGALEDPGQVRQALGLA